MKGVKKPKLVTRNTDTELCDDLLRRIAAEQRTLSELITKKQNDTARQDLAAVQDDIAGIQIANQILAGLQQEYANSGCGELPIHKPPPLTKNTHLLVSNLGKSRSSILRFDGRTGAFLNVLADIFPNSDDASYISDLVLGPNNDLYALIPNYQKLIVINGSTGNFSDFAQSVLVAWATPYSVAFGPDHNFYIADTGHSVEMAIGKFNGATGAYLGMIVQQSVNIIGGGDLIFGLDGNLYNASYYGDNRILQINPTTGNVIRVFASTATAGILEDGPVALVFGPDGDLYVGTGIEANRNNIAAVLRYDGTSGVYKGVFIQAHSGGLTQAVGLAFGPAPEHDLFVSDRDGGILRYDRRTGAFKGIFVARGSGGLRSPGKIVFRPI